MMSCCARQPSAAMLHLFLTAFFPVDAHSLKLGYSAGETCPLHSGVHKFQSSEELISLQSLHMFFSAPCSVVRCACLRDPPLIRA